MPTSCCAYGCQNRHSKGCKLSFYRFPSNSEQRKKWIAAVNRKDWQPTHCSRICSAHFVSGKLSTDPLSPDYVPTLFSFTESPVKRKCGRDLIRYERLSASKRRKIEAESLSTTQRVDDLAEQTIFEPESEPILIEPQSPPKSVSVGTVTSLTMNDIALAENQLQEIVKENVLLKEKLHKAQLDRSALQDDDNMVSFYTGLQSFTVLDTVFRFVSNTIPENTRAILNNFQQFLLLLMKLRLGLPDKDLAYRFGVSQSTVSRVVNRWIDILFVRLQPLIKWPNREEILATMPSEFKLNFRRCVVIIDCFEVFCERPSNLMARSQTWSNYKHHNTVKFLIGITPQGYISFISKGWGGRVSDKYLTENCGILKHLNPGDQVLADRGFNIQESVGLCCADVKLPPFTRGKKQLSKFEIDNSRQLSRVRIHVERVIGLLRQKYTILQSTLPIKMIMSGSDNFSTIDKIAVICAALCNCCESVVSLT